MRVKIGKQRATLQEKKSEADQLYSFQERYEKADEACDNLSSAVDSLEEAISSIEAAIE